VQRTPRVAPEGRFWDWFCAILVLLMLQVSAVRLLITDWAPALYYTETSVAFGAVLGLALGYSFYGRRGVGILSLLYTIAVLPLHLAGIANMEAPLPDRLANLGGRLWDSLLQLGVGKPVEDTLLFVAFMSVVYWLLGLSAGFYLTRHKNALAIIVPTGLVTLIIQSYDDYVPIRASLLALFCFFALVLLGRLYFAHNHVERIRRRVFETGEAALDMQKHLLIIAGAATIIAWLLPGSVLGVQAATRTWRKVTEPIREHFSNAVSGLESPYGRGRSGGFYGGSMKLGRTAILGDEPVFTVRIHTSMTESPPRFYWRGWVYDTYAAGQWSNAAAQASDFEPDLEEITLPPYGDRTQIMATVTMRVSKQALLYGPAETTRINKPGRVIASAAPDQAQDLKAWQAEPALTADTSYQLRAWVASPTAEELDAAGTEYPEWIVQRYLQVPDLLEPRLQELADQITAAQSTPYAQALAVTDYLRSEIDYSSELAAIPRNADPVLWVLFDSKEGFCTYYASAEVLLLRSLGIPARLAVGFAQGDLERGIYVVRRENAHAWPEVYFPNIGWVEFEPTVNQAELTRPSASQIGNAGLEPEEHPHGAERITIDASSGVERAEDAIVGQGAGALPFIATPLGRGIMLGGLMALVAVLILGNARLHYLDRVPALLTRTYTRAGGQPPRWLDRWAIWALLTPIERSFHAINLSLRWLGHPAPLHATPAQRASILRGLLPSAQADIDILATEHQTSLYSTHAANVSRARRAGLKITAKSLLRRLGAR